MKTHILATAICLAPSFAAAICPVQSDIQTGIVVTYDNDLFDGVFILNAAGAVDELSKNFDAEGEKYSYILTGGVFETESYIVTTQSRSTDFLTAYESNINAILPLQPQNSWAMKVNYIYSDEDGFTLKGYKYSANEFGTVEDLVLTTGALGETTIGDCVYDSFSLLFEYTNQAGETRNLRQQYLLDLGIAIYSGYADTDGSSETAQAQTIYPGSK